MSYRYLYAVAKWEHRLFCPNINCSDCSADPFQTGFLRGLGGFLTGMSQVTPQPKPQRDLSAGLQLLLCLELAAFSRVLSPLIPDTFLFSHSVVPDLCAPVDCSPPDSSVRGLLEFQALSSHCSETSRLSVDSPSAYFSLGFTLAVNSGTRNAYSICFPFLRDCCHVSLLVNV